MFIYCVVISFDVLLFYSDYSLESVMKVDNGCCRKFKTLMKGQTAEILKTM